MGQGGVSSAPERGSSSPTLTIQREVQNDGVHYQIDQQTTVGGGTNHLEAHILCRPDELDTLKSWEILTHYQTPSGEKDPRLTMREVGQNNRQSLQIHNGDYRFEHHPRNPVVSQWTVLHYLMTHGARSTAIPFDLLQDLSLFKPNQTLSYDGQIEIAVRDNPPLVLNTYAQTGVAIQPIHYLLDGQSRPHLITFSILAWVLTGMA